MTGNTVLILAEDQVNDIVAALSPDAILESQSLAFKLVNNNIPWPSECPNRISTSSSKHTYLYMPGRAGISAQKGVTAVKMVAVPKHSASADGIPGVISVFNEDTGLPNAFINARILTGLRTAAGSVLATKVLSSYEHSSMVVFGSGVQAEFHVRLHLQANLSIERVTIVLRNENYRSAALLDRLRKLFPTVVFAFLCTGNSDDESQLEKVIRETKLICTCVPSEHVLFKPEWVVAGTHINMVGSYKPHMQEVDTKLLGRAVVGTSNTQKIVVDSIPAVCKEAGEVIQALSTGELKMADIASIGDLLGTDICRPQKENITVFKSVGVGLQDVMIADLVMKEALRRNIGNRVPF